jgi:hypothetical protein
VSDPDLRNATGMYFSVYCILKIALKMPSVGHIWHHLKCGGNTYSYIHVLGAFYYYLKYSEYVKNDLRDVATFALSCVPT